MSKFYGANSGSVLTCIKKTRARSNYLRGICRLAEDCNEQCAHADAQTTDKKMALIGPFSLRFCSD